jgi:hypothetical protein
VIEINFNNQKLCLPDGNASATISGLPFSSITINRAKNTRLEPWVIKVTIVDANGKQFTFSKTAHGDWDREDAYALEMWCMMNNFPLRVFNAINAIAILFCMQIDLPVKMPQSLKRSNDDDPFI